MTERTTPEFPSQPIGGGTWHEYFSRRAKDRADLTSSFDGDNDDNESFGTVEVTVPAHEPEEGWPRALAGFAKLAVSNGWTARVGHSAAWHYAVLYADKLKGIKKPAHAEEQWWMNAVKDGVYITVSYNYSEGKSSGRTRRFIRGDETQLSDKEMKEVIKGAEADSD